MDDEIYIIAIHNKHESSNELSAYEDLRIISNNLDVPMCP